MLNYISFPQLAGILGVTRGRVWQMYKEKKLKAVKFAKLYAVTEREAKRVIKSQILKKTKRKIEKMEKKHEKNIAIAPATLTN